jgi:hypothetical protein
MCLLIAVGIGVAHSDTMTNLGLVGVKSSHGYYLQGHYPDGEIHASNDKRNEEETWFLIRVTTDQGKVYYALQNWRNHKFMKKTPGPDGCTPAVATALTPTEEWELVKVPAAPNAVALKSRWDGTFLSANDGSSDTPCGGEVHSQSTIPPAADSGSSELWVIEPATVPEPGRNFWNTVGPAVWGFVVNVAPIAVQVLAGL